MVIVVVELESASRARAAAAKLRPIMVSGSETADWMEMLCVPARSFIVPLEGNRLVCEADND